MNISKNLGPISANLPWQKAHKCLYHSIIEYLCTIIHEIYNMKQDKPVKKKKSLDGITLEMMLIDLSTYIGWEKMAEKVSINCFKSNPSVKSSLAFLRRTPWARDKVETLYRFSMHKIEVAKGNGTPATNKKVEKTVPEEKSKTGLFPLDHFMQKGSNED